MLRKAAALKRICGRCAPQNAARRPDEEGKEDEGDDIDGRGIKGK